METLGASELMNGGERTIHKHKLYNCPMRSKAYQVPVIGRAVFELFSKFITPGCSKCAIGGTDHVGIFLKIFEARLQVPHRP